MNDAPRTALVTGATGYVGGLLVPRLLQAGYAVRVLTRSGNLPAAWADRVTDYTLETFPEGPGREWTQIRTRTGAPLEKVVALPVKDPFHVARALLLLTELESGHRPVPTGTAGTKGER